MCLVIGDQEIGVEALDAGGAAGGEVLSRVEGPDQNLDGG